MMKKYIKGRTEMLEIYKMEALTAAILNPGTAGTVVKVSAQVTATTYCAKVTVASITNIGENL